jgi:hypothetical protein
MRVNLVISTMAAILLVGSATVHSQGEAPSQNSASDPSLSEGAESPIAADLRGQVSAAFVSSFSDDCASIHLTPIEERVPEEFQLKFRYSTDSAASSDRTMELYRFLCKKEPSSGAETHVYYLHYVGGVKIVAFSEPFVHVEYENEDISGKVLGVKIIGQRARVILDNSKLDINTNTIMSQKNWNSVGDPPSKGVWVLREDSFVLSTFEVDASFDGDDNPVTVLDYRAENETLSETP